MSSRNTQKSFAAALKTTRDDNEITKPERLYNGPMSAVEGAFKDKLMDDYMHAQTTMSMLGLDTKKLNLGNDEPITPTKTVGFGDLEANESESRFLIIESLDEKALDGSILSAFGGYSLETFRKKESLMQIAFVNPQDAIVAKDTMNKNGSINLDNGSSVKVNVSFGKTVEGDHSSVSTRSLYIGNLPATVSIALLHQIFQPYGQIESCRVLTNKTCGFVNFFLESEAFNAKKALDGTEVFGTALKINFAKSPSNTTSIPEAVSSPIRGALKLNTSIQPMSPGAYSSQSATFSPRIMTPLTFYQNRIQPNIPKDMGVDQSVVSPLVAPAGFGELKGQKDEFKDTFPPLPDFKKMDQGKLREYRRKLDGNHSQRDFEFIYKELIDEILPLSADYIGNTIVQKLALKGNNEKRLHIIKSLSPYFATLGAHKHGTWVIQKLIDIADTDDQMDAVCAAVKAYTPPLMIDQFGNYVVQCCLRLGATKNQFIYDAMHTRCLDLGQSRFGARAMRACLDSQYAEMKQKKHVALAIIRNVLSLSTNPNGTLLANWLLDASNLPGRYRVVAPQIVAHLVQLCTHKLASQIVFKIVQQNQDVDARQMVLKEIFFATTVTPGSMNVQEYLILEDILSDQMYGAPFVQRVLNSVSDPEESRALQERCQQVMTNLNASQAPGHRYIQQAYAAAHVAAISSMQQQPSSPLNILPPGVNNQGFDSIVSPRSQGFNFDKPFSPKSESWRQWSPSSFEAPKKPDSE